MSQELVPAVREGTSREEEREGGAGGKGEVIGEEREGGGGEEKGGREGQMERKRGRQRKW